MVNNDTGMMLATIRQVKRMSQVQLSLQSGVPASYISRFEAGQLALSDKHQDALQQALGINFDKLRPIFKQLAAAILQPSAH